MTSYSNVGVILRFAGGSVRQMTERWPSDIDERAALQRVLNQLSNQSLDLLYSMQISPHTRNTTKTRIAWLEQPPRGMYYFNQHKYDTRGEVASHIIATSQAPVEYDPDEFSVAPVGQLLDVYDNQQQAYTPNGPNGDLLRDFINVNYHC